MCPFSQMIMWTSERDQEASTCWKAGISQITLPWWDWKVSNTSIMEHSRVSSQSLPTRKDINKLHVKTTHCKTVLGYHAFAITVGMTFDSRGIASKMSTIHCTKTILEEWK
jgi:hypothetical protein